MSKKDKILKKILEGLSDPNIDFHELCQLLINLGFTERIRGSHHIFFKEGIDEILNLQSIGNKAKPYQIKQVRNVIIKNKMGNIDE